MSKGQEQQQYHLLFPSTARPHLPLPLVLTVLTTITALALLWGWKTSGVLENTMVLDTFPYGYRYIIDTHYLGSWPIGREGFFYYQALQGFLGTDDAFVNVGSGYEISRTFYPFLLRSLWFVEPVLAVLLLDIILWSLAALSAAYVAYAFTQLQSAAWFGAIFVILGQGFLQSVGEGVGHVLGYSVGFYIAFLITFLQTWQKDTSFKQDLMVYTTIGLLQLGYGTAIFSLPLAVVATMYRLWQQDKGWFAMMAYTALACIYAMLPILVFSIFIKLAGLPGNSGMVLQLLMNQQHGLSGFLIQYLLTFADGIVSLGPLFIVAITCLLVVTAYQCNRFLAVVLLAWLAPICLMTLVIMPVNGRGYATFNLAAIPLISFATFCGYYWHHYKQLWVKSVLVGLCCVCLLYPHSKFFGNRFYNLFFQSGFSTLDQRWQTYEIHTFK